MKKYSVLVVDDEENVSNLICKVLKKEGFSTYMAANAKEALHIIDHHDINIVITDIKMPGISGIELLNKIKEIDSSITVILITAFATLETAIDALRGGAKDYITKPFNLEEVVLAVKNLVNTYNESECNSKIFSLDKNEGSNMVTESFAMKKVMDLIAHVAATKVTIILYGETGTGKEVAANTIHKLSGRNNNPFIKVNCAAIPETLLESELFGYERGAFTGANTFKPGKFELADGGSIFLDEIGDIPPSVQVKLLRVLQEKEFERLGGTKTIKVDVRIIAATNKDLFTMVKEGTFREDLYYRLNVVPIEIPPLRDRKEDIPMLIEHFLLKSSDISGRPPKHITKEAVEKLIQYNWTGNIRELDNIIERCVVITEGDIITENDLPPHILDYKREEELEEEEIKSLDAAIDSIEREMIMKTLKECEGNRTKAAEALGISRRSLHRKIAKYNLEEV